MVKYSQQKLDLTFAALSDPTRRAILANLAKGASTVLEIAEPFSISLPGVSKHLKVLENAGLLERTIDGRVHTCKLNAEPLKDAVSWIEKYRHFWESQFRSLDSYLKNTIDEDTNKKK